MGLFEDIGGSQTNTLLSLLAGPSSGRGSGNDTGDFLSWLAGPRRSASPGMFPTPRTRSPQAAPTSYATGGQDMGRRATGPEPIPNLTPEYAREHPMEPIPNNVLVDHSSRDGFIRSMYRYAKTAEAQTGIPAEIMIAINLNEQGWQKQAPGNNYFGIKGSNPRTGANTGPVGTWEDYGSGRQDIQDTFRAYESPAESYADFGQFLKDNPRYQKAMNVLAETGDGEAFIREVHAAGYATDPQWSNKIISIAREVKGKTTPDPFLELLVN